MAIDTMSPAIEFSPFLRSNATSWLLVALALASYAIGRVFNRRSLRHLRGPPSPSFLLGQEYEINHQKEVGDLDFQWMRQYGSTWRVDGYFGSEWLMTCDARAIQHIFQKAGHLYGKKQDNIHLGRIISPGIVAVSGDDHKRQRKVMNPAFNPAHLRTYLPLFQHLGSKLVTRMKKEVATAPATIPINNWLSRATLEIIGKASFGYSFDTIENAETPLAVKYTKLFSDTGVGLSKATLLFRASWLYLPLWLIDLLRFVPFHPFTMIRDVNKEFEKIGHQLVEQNAEAKARGEEGGKDVLSVLMRANASEDPRSRLDEDEVMAQLHTLTIAGHETTANTLAWLTYELARHPEYQTRLREEIRRKREEVRERGGDVFTVEDVDSMKVAMNAIKETLRYHSIVYHMYRVALQDDVIPLDDPIVTKSGEKITEVPVRAGQVILISFAGYHRLPHVWGEDADVWNPDRFDRIDATSQTRVGFISNIMAFCHRGCIGWKFSLLEMQALLAELVESFEFSIGPNADKPRRTPASAAMLPMVPGKEEAGPMLLLDVTLAK